MVNRVITALVLLAIGVPALILGGVFYFLLIGSFLTVAIWEYANMLSASGHKPARLMMVVFTPLIFGARYFFPEFAIPVFVLSILAAMAYHLFDYEGGRDQAATDFNITVAGLAYIGWLGSYLGELRNLPNGNWWVLIVLPGVWVVDTAAYLVGVRIGKTKMTPRLSPKKSWEGFWAGLVGGTLGVALFAWLGSSYGGLTITPLQGAILGFMLGLLTPLGDLGESMLKREAHLKDSGQILPGHGGIFDRIDSWLWAAIIGYYFIIWFVK